MHSRQIEDDLSVIAEYAREATAQNAQKSPDAKEADEDEKRSAEEGISIADLPLI